MLRNYFKIAIRNLFRNKGFSLINIGGLAIGMASALLILLWIRNEMTYDRYFPKTSRLYTLYNRDKFNGRLQCWNQTPKTIAPLLQKDYPGVEQAARYVNITFLTTVGDTHLDSRGAFVDSSFIGMFDWPMLRGDSHALSGGYNIVLTEGMARRLFGSQDPIGKTVRVDSSENFVVSGIMKDLPSNTSFQFDYLLPWSFMTRLGWDDAYWGNNSTNTYVLLKPGVSQAGFDQQIKNITKSHSGETTEVFAQSMDRLHLYSKAEDGQLVAGRINDVRLFAVIAAFILLIACINFMNLSTARSEKRAREVGIRKVVGAYKFYLVMQFIGESMIISVLSFLAALFLTQISLSAFSQLVGKELSIDYSDPRFWFFSLAFVFFTGLLAGSYPAFYLSSFQPIKVLKGTFKKVDALVSTRKVLVIVQFSFAIILIICTLIIQRQIKYAEDRDAGYDRRGLVYSFTQGEAYKNYRSIRHDLLAEGAAVSVTRTSGPITRHWSDDWGFSWEGSTVADKKIDFVTLGTEGNFVRTMGATLLSGRDIDIDKYPTDSTAILLNEAAVKSLRLKNPLGAVITRKPENWHVVGVIKDFILESPYAKEIPPMFIQGPSTYCQVMHYKLNPANSISTNLAKAERIFKRYNPQYPFEYVFTDEGYAKKFKEEQTTGALAALFAGLTIFISCLGLFALATYMAENRIREIGVRKVLGASVTSITTLLAKDFVRLVLIAFVIAAPAAWYAMDKWLNNFGYRINIGWTVFALSGGLAVLIALMTIGYQSIRAAIASPIKSLRSE